MKKDLDFLNANKVSRIKEFDPTVKHIMQMLTSIQGQVSKAGKAASKRGQPLKTLDEANKGNRNNQET